MTMTISSNTAAVPQKKHTTAKHLINAGLTGTALYGLGKGAGYYMEPFSDALCSGKEIKVSAGKVSSFMNKFFNGLGSIILPRKSLLKVAERYVDANPALDPKEGVKLANKFKAARGGIALLATTGLAALTILGLGIRNFCKINSENKQ